MYQMKSFLNRIKYHLNVFYDNKPITYLTEAFRKIFFCELFDCFFAKEKNIEKHRN